MMIDPINWKDDYFCSNKRIVLTSRQLQIPGIRTFGVHTMQSAVQPLKPHFHEDSFEITYVTKGVISFHVNDVEYKVNGGDAFIAFPNEVHSTNEIPLSLGQIYWLQLDISNPANFLYLNENAAIPLINSLQKIKHHNIRTDNKEIRNILVKSFDLASSSGNEYMVASYIAIYLHLLIKFSKESQFPLTPDIGKALTYIMDNITSDLSLDDIAESCLLSTSHFKQKFKNQMGISPRNFINQQKVEYAKTLLPDCTSITDMSMALGFSSSSYFSVVFKKYTSYSPTEFIQRKANKSAVSSDDIP